MSDPTGTESLPRLKVLALTRYTRMAPSSRLRFYNLQAPLADYGIMLDIAPFFSESYLRNRYAGQRVVPLDLLASYLRRFSALRRLPLYDAVWVQAEMLPLFPAGFESLLLGRLAKSWVLDIDDAWFLPHDGTRLALLHRLQTGKIPHLSQRSTLCSITQAHCRAMLQAQGGRADVIIGQGLDLQRYHVAPRRGGQPVTIGWIGTPTTAYRYLPMVAATLNRLQDETGCRMVLVGAGDAVPELRAERRFWREETEIQDVQEFDIGIMPLLDTPWERGKSGLKLAQSMACGRVAVGTAVGFNNDLVAHGVDGILVPPGAEGWHAALLPLLQDAALRDRLGTAARRKIESQFDFSGVVKRIAAMLRQAAQTGRRDIAA